MLLGQRLKWTKISILHTLFVSTSCLLVCFTFCFDKIPKKIFKRRSMSFGFWSQLWHDHRQEENSSHHSCQETERKRMSALRMLPSVPRLFPFGPRSCGMLFSPLVVDVFSLDNYLRKCFGIHFTNLLTVPQPNWQSKVTHQWHDMWTLFLTHLQ